MAFYQTFTVTRTTEPHFETLQAQLRALDPTAGVQHQAPSSLYRIKKATTWTAPQIAAALNVLETAPVSTPALVAQAYIDRLPLAERAWKELEVEEFNRLRAALRALGAPNLPDLTYTTIVNQWRTRAGQLS